MSDSRSDGGYVDSLLLRLSWMGTPDAADALLGLLRDGKHVIGHEAAWASILGELDGEAFDVVLAEHLYGRLRSPSVRASNASELWAAYYKRLGVGAGEEIARLLSSRDLSQSSRFRGEVLAGISSDVGEEARVAVTRELENPGVAREAFGALVRMGDEESASVAMDYLLRDGPYSPDLAREFGPHVTPARADSLWIAADGDVRFMPTYLAALSAAPSGISEAQAKRLHAGALRSLRHFNDSSDPHGVRRTSIAGSLERSAEFVYSRELLREVVRQIDRSPVGRRQFVVVASRMRDLLRNPPANDAMPGAITVSPPR